MIEDRMAERITEAELIRTDRHEYRLKIDAYSPETMPMKRLAEYLSDMAVLLGEEGSVHLIGIESGSICPVVLVDWAAEPNVQDRLARVRANAGPEDALRAAQSIDARLAKDNATADLIGPTQAKLFQFPGASRPKPIEWPSINQSGTLIGVPIAVGGKNEQVPVHLQDGDAEYFLLADRDKAKRSADYLFTTTLRVSGRGRWRKQPSGPWLLERFVVDDFELVKTSKFGEALDQLRGIDAAWKHLDDPLAVLEGLRTGSDPA